MVIKFTIHLGAQSKFIRKKHGVQVKTTKRRAENLNTQSEHGMEWKRDNEKSRIASP